MTTRFTTTVTFAAAFAVLAFTTPAGAVSQAVKSACANDYFAHCSMHAVGSPGVRKCMRAVGPRLSKPCITALVADGQVNASDRKRYKSATTKVAQKRSKKKHLRVASDD